LRRHFPWLFREDGSRRRPRGDSMTKTMS
jgi:hypothetical protein